VHGDRCGIHRLNWRFVRCCVVVGSTVAQTMHTTAAAPYCLWVWGGVGGGWWWWWWWWWWWVGGWVVWVGVCGWGGGGGAAKAASERLLALAAYLASLPYPAHTAPVQTSSSAPPALSRAAWLTSSLDVSVRVLMGVGYVCCVAHCAEEL
jgi:hypothetical protein